MIAIAVMKIIKVIGWNFEMTVKETIKMAMRFMWMPGIRPVRVPAIIPRRSGMIK